MKKTSILFAVLALVISTAPFGAAQESPETKVKVFAREQVWRSLEFSGKPVKGSPYSADAVTESTQVLADGNRIVNKSTAKLYRDSEGRTRREQTINVTINGSAQTRQNIFINDPVSGLNYVLDPDNHTARKANVFFFTSDKEPPPGGPLANAARVGEPTRAVTNVETAIVGMGTGTQTFTYVQRSNNQQGKTESLGKRMIEEVEVEGTRETITIAAGEIGNERAIEIVSERWYSPKLQAVVMSTRSDPRTGQTTYRLQNINLSEPGHSLFEVPPAYTIADGPESGSRVVVR